MMLLFFWAFYTFKLYKIKHNIRKQSNQSTIVQLFLLLSALPFQKGPWLVISSYIFLSVFLRKIFYMEQILPTHFFFYF